MSFGRKMTNQSVAYLHTLLYSSEKRIHHSHLSQHDELREIIIYFLVVFLSSVHSSSHPGSEGPCLIPRSFEAKLSPSIREGAYLIPVSF